MVLKIKFLLSSFNPSPLIFNFLFGFMQRVFLPTPNSPIPPLSDHYGVLVSIDFPISASGASGLFWSFTSLLMSFALVVWAI